MDESGHSMKINLKNDVVTKSGILVPLNTLCGCMFHIFVRTYRNDRNENWLEINRNLVAAKLIYTTGGSIYWMKHSSHMFAEKMQQLIWSWFVWFQSRIRCTCGLWSVGLTKTERLLLESVSFFLYGLFLRQPNLYLFGSEFRLLIAQELNRLNGANVCSDIPPVKF